MASPAEFLPDESMPVQLVRVSGWSDGDEPRLPWLMHGFSTRVGGATTAYRRVGSRAEGGNLGDLNLGFTASDDHKVVAANRERFVNAATQDKPILGLVTLRQIHSSTLLRVGSGDVRSLDAQAVLEGDGLMTSEPGVLLGIQTADCIPVLVADQRMRAVAAFHAGWRGTAARIVETGIARMQSEFGSKPEDLIAFIGPGIGQCCYAIGDEVQETFGSQFAYAADLFRSVDPGPGNSGSTVRLDLAEANRRQLLDAGLGAAAIFLTGLCTGCRTDLFFSHRIERGFTGRLLSVIGVAQPSA